jgi:hypothetical protein
MLLLRTDELMIVLRRYFLGLRELTQSHQQFRHPELREEVDRVFSGLKAIARGLERQAGQPLKTPALTEFALTSEAAAAAEYVISVAIQHGASCEADVIGAILEDERDFVCARSGDSDAARDAVETLQEKIEALRRVALERRWSDVCALIDAGSAQAG